MSFLLKGGPHTIEDKVFYQFDGSSSALDICKQIINIDVVIQLLVQQSNLYLQQNGRNFLTDAKEIKDFIDVNYIMPVKHFPSLPM